MNQLGLEFVITTQGAEQAVGAINRVKGAAEDAAGAKGTQGVGALNDAMGQLTDYFAKFATVTAAVDALKHFADAGMEAAQSTRLLNAQLTLAGGGLNVFGDEAEHAVHATSALGLSTETQATQALQRLVLVTGNAEWSLQHLAVAQNIAAATGMDLTTAATDLGRGYNGVWMQLERLGLVTKEQVASGGAMDALIAKTKDMAQAATEGAGAWTKLGTAFGNFLEEAAKTAAEKTGSIATFLLQVREVSARVQRRGLTEATHGFIPLPDEGTPLPAGFGTLPAGGFGGLSAADAFTPPKPEQISLGPTDDQAAEQAKYDKLAADRARNKADAAKRQLQPWIDVVEQFKRDLQKEVDDWNKTFAKMPPILADVIAPSLSPTAHQIEIPEGGIEGAAPESFEKLTNSTKVITDQLQRVKDLAERNSIDIGQTIWDGIAKGLATKHGGVSAAFRSMGAEVLQAMGEMFLRMAPPLMVFGHIMEALQSVLTTNPLLGGALAIVAGVALEALGASLGAAAAGTGGPSITGSIGQSINSRQYLTPATGAPFAAGEQWPGRSVMQPNITIIGTNDSGAQAQMRDFLTNMVRRNMVVPGLAG